MREVWKDIPDLQGYRISNLGNVESCRYGTGGGVKFGKWRKIVPKLNGRKDTLTLAIRKESRMIVRFQLHRLLYQLFIGPIPEGHEVDHIDRNSLNNGLSNLRLATRSQNVMNQKHREGRKHKGVRPTKSGKWECRTSYKGKQIALGIHATEIEAALAYNEYAKKTFGEYAVLNKVR